MAITKIQSESLNLADTYDFTGTVTGAGGVNTPAFFVYKNTSQTLNDETDTKVTWTTERFDTNNANWKYDPVDCIRKAEEFSEESFIEKFKEGIKSRLLI